MISKSYVGKSNRKLLYFISAFLVILINSCSSTKYIAENEAIIRKISVDSLNDAMTEAAYSYIQKDILPGGRISLYRVLYNTFNVKDSKYRTENIKNIGTPPAILDSNKVEISRKEIEKFLHSKGYVNAKVTDSIAIKNKNANIHFRVDLKSRFTIQDIAIDIRDSGLRKIYLEKIRKADYFLIGKALDEENLSKIRDQIYHESQHDGYYGFLRQYIHYEIDTNFNNSSAKVKLIIDNPENKKQHPRYQLGHTNVIISPNSEGFVGDSIAFSHEIENDIRYTDLSKKFRRNAILIYDFLKKGEPYNTEKESLTLNRLYQLNVFKNIKIDYSKNSDSTQNIIHPLIMLTPYKQMSNRIDIEAPFNRDILGLNVSNTFTNSNLFGGAERLELQLGGGFYAHTSLNPFTNIYQRTFSASANLSIPRLIVPFKIPLIAKNGEPHTTFSTSYIYNLQENVLSRRIFISTITYDWVETKSKLHSLSPLNFEYRFGNLLLDDFDAAELFRVSTYNYQLLNRKSVTLGIKYAYDLNSDKLNSDRNFVYFRGTLESAGNLLGLITRFSNIKSDPHNNIFAHVLGVPYNQYLRPEVDIRWYKNMGYNKTFVTRFNAGVGYAYGNSAFLPFEKMFFAGGSTGIRAWQARTLGPGNYNRASLENESQRKAFIGIDQLGSLLLQGNLEYRFMMANNFAGGKIKGALFMDGGNVWELPQKNEPDIERRSFKFNARRLASQIAIGTGFGIRYDVDYFVFRLDIGFKVKDPQFGGNDQWVIKHLFSNSSEFKRQYNITHSPDNYRFVQYNFGIGLPF